MPYLKGHYAKFPNYTPRPGGAEYKIVAVDTVEGLETAEKLHEEGWETASAGLTSITFWRPKNPDERA